MERVSYRSLSASSLNGRFLNLQVLQVCADGRLELSDGNSRTTVRVVCTTGPAVKVYQVRQFAFSKEGVTAGAEVAEIGFELIGGDTFKAHGVPRPLSATALFMRERRLSAQVSHAAPSRRAIAEPPPRRTRRRRGSRSAWSSARCTPARPRTLGERPTPR